MTIADVQITAEFPGDKRERDICSTIKEIVIEEARNGIIGSLAVQSVIIKGRPL